MEALPFMEDGGSTVINETVKGMCSRAAAVDITEVIRGTAVGNSQSFIRCRVRDVGGIAGA